MPFRFAIVVSSNPINFINEHSVHSKPACEQCALTKLNGLLLTAVVSQNSIHSCLVYAEKGKFWASTLCHKMNKLLNQIADLSIIFSQEKLLHTLIPVIASTYMYCGEYPVPVFFYGPCCIHITWTLHLRISWRVHPHRYFKWSLGLCDQPIKMAGSLRVEMLKTHLWDSDNWLKFV